MFPAKTCDRRKARCAQELKAALPFTPSAPAAITSMRTRLETASGHRPRDGQTAEAFATRVPSEVPSALQFIEQSKPRKRPPSVLQNALGAL